MKTKLKRILKVDARFWQLLTFLFFSVSLLFTVFQSALVRFVEAVRDFGTSVAYWFLFAYSVVIENIFGEVPEVYPTILDFPATSFEEVLNIDFDEILAKIERFPGAYFDLLPDYNVWLFDRAYWISLYIMMVSPILIALPFIIKQIMLSPNDRPIGYISKPARVFLWLLKRILNPCRDFLRSYLDFMGDHKVVTGFLMVIWLLNFNVITVVLEFFSFYYYFISSYNFTVFLMFIVKFLLDVLILLLCMPLFYWLILSVRIFWRVCEYRALDRLQHMESQNCGFLKTLDIVTLIIGEPGKGKTTLLTDFVLSWVNIYKTESLKTMYRYQIMFPSFCFAKYREVLIQNIEEHKIFCLPQVNDFVDELFNRYEATQDRTALFGYRDDLFKTVTDVGNRDVTLREALKTYGRAFMIYYNNNPSLSNYPIRFDGNFDESDHLKLWNGDFFTRKKISRYSRILNQDMLRHGKKIDAASKELGAFGYGIYSHTELAKSVGNQNTNAIYDVMSDEANPKNDKHSYSYMMGRHPYSTVDNFVYFRYIGDEQRASSLMAEELGLMSVLSIAEKGEQLLAISCFGWLMKIRAKYVESFKAFFKERDNVRDDVTLSMLLLTYCISVLDLFGLRLENRFGYREVVLDRQQGSAFSGNTGTTNTAGGVKSHVYYQMNMKDYSDRFPTDAYRSLYAEAQKACGMGIMDMPEYGSLDMTIDEMNYQRDHFLRNLMVMLHGEGDFQASRRRKDTQVLIDNPVKSDRKRKVL